MESNKDLKQYQKQTEVIDVTNSSLTLSNAKKLIVGAMIYQFQLLHAMGYKNVVIGISVMFQMLKYFISPKTSGKKKILEIECQNVRNGIDGQGHDFKLNLNF